jgi:hypothetical protein
MAPTITLGDVKIEVDGAEFTFARHDVIRVPLVDVPTLRYGPSRSFSFDCVLTDGRALSDLIEECARPEGYTITLTDEVTVPWLMGRFLEHSVQPWEMPDGSEWVATCPRLLSMAPDSDTMEIRLIPKPKAPAGREG